MNELWSYAVVGVVGMLLAIPTARASNGPWIALCLLIVSATVAREPFGLPFETDGLTVPLLAMTLLLRDPKRVVRLSSYPLLGLTMGYLIVNLIATIMNPPLTYLAVKQFAILGVRVATFYLVIMTIQANPTRSRQIPLVLFGLTLVHVLSSFAAYALADIVDMPMVWYEHHGLEMYSLSGFFLEPNSFGAFLATMIGLGLPVLTLAGGSRARGLLVASMTAATPALVLTFTRSAWLGVAMAAPAFLVLLAVFERDQFRRGVSVVLLFTLLASASLGLGMVLTRHATLGLPEWQTGGTAELDTGEDPDLTNSAVWERLTEVADPSGASASGRISAWMHAVRQWREKPLLGHGLLSLSAINDGWLYSSTVQALHDSGLVGLTLMLSIVALIARTTWTGQRAAASVPDRAILLGYFVAQGVLFFTSQFSTYFWGAYTWVLLGAAVGHAHVVLRPPQSRGVDRPSGSVSTGRGT